MHVFAETKIKNKQKKQPHANKSLGSNEFAGESYQTYNKLISILFKLFFKTEEQGIPQSHSMKLSSL